MQVIKKRNSTESINLNKGSGIVNYESIHDEIAFNKRTWRNTWVVINNWGENTNQPVKDSRFPWDMKLTSEWRDSVSNEYIITYESDQYILEYNALILLCLDATQAHFANDDFWGMWRMCINTNNGAFCSINRRYPEPPGLNGLILGTYYNDASFIVSKGAYLQFHCQLVHLNGKDDKHDVYAANSFFDALNHPESSVWAQMAIFS